MALAFDASDKFGYDKPAGEPCRHLDAEFRCTIHDKRGDLGFAGCAGYDCLGAGQRVTQMVFGGASWRNRPDLKPRMQHAFRVMREVHKMIDLLILAGKLPLDTQQSADREELLSSLSPAEDWTEDSLLAFERGPIPKQVSHYLSRLDTAAAEMLKRRDCKLPNRSTKTGTGG